MYRKTLLILKKAFDSELVPGVHVWIRSDDIRCLSGCDDLLPADFVICIKCTTVFTSDKFLSEVCLRSYPCVSHPDQNKQPAARSAG